jgi:hypothetical protein
MMISVRTRYHLELMLCAVMLLSGLTELLVGRLACFGVLLVTCSCWCVLWCGKHHKHKSHQRPVCMQQAAANASLSAFTTRHFAPILLRRLVADILLKCCCCCLCRYGTASLCEASLVWC